MDTEELNTRKRKRGVVNLEKHKRNRIKNRRIKGTEYKNYKGSVLHAKSIRVPCNCKLKCFTKLTAEQRITVFTKFYNLNTKDEQDIYLQGLVHLEPIKQRRHRQAPNMEGNMRQSAFKYYITVDGVRNKICKRAFLSLHSNTNKILQRLQQLLRVGATPKDKRGKQMFTLLIVTIIGVSLAVARVEQPKEGDNGKNVKHYSNVIQPGSLYEGHRLRDAQGGNPLGRIQDVTPEIP